MNPIRSGCSNISLAKDDPEAGILKEAPKDYSPRVVLGIRPCDARAFQLVDVNFDTPPVPGPLVGRSGEPTPPWWDWPAISRARTVFAPRWGPARLIARAGCAADRRGRRVHLLQAVAVTKGKNSSPAFRGSEPAAGRQRPRQVAALQESGRSRLLGIQFRSGSNWPERACTSCSTRRSGTKCSSPASTAGPAPFFAPPAGVLTSRTKSAEDQG